VRYLLDMSRVECHLARQFFAFNSRYRKDGELVALPPSTAIIEIPHRGVGFLRLVARIAWLVEDEGADGVVLGGGEVGHSAILTEPRSEGNQVVVGRREICLAGDVGRDKIVLLDVACGIGAYVRDVDEALDDAIESIGVVSTEGGYVFQYAVLVC
jgi:hypothetical protein